MKELFIEAKLQKLDTVQEFISEELESYDCPMKTQTQIAIAVEEIFVNIARYAYDKDAWASGQACSPTPQGERSAKEAGSVTIRITVGDNITIEFEDWGKPFNPLEKAVPDITTKAEEREIGGMGIYMVKNIMDSVEYRREGNKNILLIKKVVAGK